MENVRIVYLDMPATVKAYTLFNDDYYTIVLNQNLSREQNLISYYHELDHIYGNDFDKTIPVSLIEYIRH